ncbi:uncharacterized protein LOC118761068 [Octopus sinensis]|uniref:Uncharacterized protein LOC118761068 n=1 Tax=Octopus sinensis TaxID=2607531 RepID=A0A7E6EI20_9MOLL|nr:uncharacterized protein LOC118761068 [Octopus sinensis]
MAPQLDSTRTEHSVRMKNWTMTSSPNTAFSLTIKPFQSSLMSFLPQFMTRTVECGNSVMLTFKVFKELGMEWLLVLTYMIGVPINKTNLIKLSKKNIQISQFSVITSRIYANSTLRLDKVNYFGFDMDYTLASKSPEMEKLIFDLIKQHLVEIGYPTKFLEFNYNPEFPVRKKSPLSSCRSSRILNANLGVNHQSVLYVGDSIYGDILKSKKISWKTFLIIPDLKSEIFHWKKCLGGYKILDGLDKIQQKQMYSQIFIPQVYL